MTVVMVGLEDVAMGATTADGRVRRGQRWSDTGPAIRRRRRGRGFSYTDARGRRLTDGRTLERIAGLVIPPAWTDVRINPDPAGRLQAVGRDARGRKQYLYRASWRAARERAKFRELATFGNALPAIRRQVAADLRRRGLVRPRVLALLVRLLDLTAMRVGNEAYQRANRSFGLTTLRRTHADVRGATVTLRYRGKGGKVQEAAVRDARVARLVRRLLEAGGRRLFVYRDGDSRLRPVRSSDVNDYLRAVAGPGVSAKAFRTWGATVLATRALIEATADARDDPPSAAGQRRASRPSGGTARRTSPILRAALAEVADHLGDTPTVARQAYVHPAVVAAHEADELPSVRRRHHDSSGSLAGTTSPTAATTGLSADERRTLDVLRAAARDDPDGQGV